MPASRAAITAEAFEALIRQGLPMLAEAGIQVVAIGAGTIRLRQPFRSDSTRPGGTVSGPVMFALADVALYGAVLSRIGRVELAVTTSMTINFLRGMPPGQALIAEARLLKLGKRLAYGAILLYAEGDAEPVAHVTGTYSVPPVRSGEA